jgi:putative phosphoribosyl transferase
MIPFADRVEAGQRLGERLQQLRGDDVVVLGLPRGGVPVAAEVARALGAPLDVIVVRKLGVPYQPELAMGAIGEGGVRMLDDYVLRHVRVSDLELSHVEERQRAELEARVARLRQGRPRLDLTGRTALIVDDGIATGSTARAACQVARNLGATRVVMAAPVGAQDTIARFTEADEVVCLATPAGFAAVGPYYRDFSATSDEEVVRILEEAARRVPRPGTPPVSCDEDVRIPFGGHVLEGHLHLQATAPGVVVFAHGSGSSRHSPRNRYVAEVLQGAGLGTLLLDLLTTDEERDRARGFDIAGLATRLEAATEWLTARADVVGREVGYFGASTGAGAALWAAADPRSQVAAVVSRGGRPDLAGARVSDVRAPTLFIVGGEDHAVLELNRGAQQLMTCPTSLRVVPGATHLFEEPGTLAEAATLARDWFVRHLAPGQAAVPREGS